MKQRINIRLGLIALIAIVTTEIGTTFVYYSLFQRQVQNDLKQTALLLAETGMFQDEIHEDDEQTESVENFSYGGIRITWIGEDGTVLFDNNADYKGMANHMDRPEVQQALKKGEGESTRHSDTMNMDTFYYALLLKNHTILRVSMQARTISSVLVTALPVIAVIAVFILFGCVMIGHLLTGQIMKPIELMANNLDNGSKPAYKELEPFLNTIRIQHENILAVARSRQDFTANVSHELKTPITAISGYAELIENGLADQESEMYIAGQIRHNAERLQSLISDIIQLSELDHSEIPRTFEPVDLYAIAGECVDDLRPLAEKRMVTVTCVGTSARINADRALIREMTENLVQNSIRYNKENGSVEVCTAVKNNHAVICVKDTGIGIPSDQLDRVFERFYRVDKSRSRQTGGTGLGLAIVKHIAELHSADITIESEAGAGTEITVSF